MRSEDGGILEGGHQTGSTLMCRHCGCHWEVRPGSGVQRGWCRKCSGPLCGGWACLKSCVPLEARLEHAEGAKTSYEHTIRELMADGAVLL